MRKWQDKMKKAKIRQNGNKILVKKRDTEKAKERKEIYSVREAKKREGENWKD